MDLKPYLSRLPLAHCATEEELQLAAQYAYIASFARGEVIHTRSQTECPGMVLVLTGALCASMISDEGKQILLYRLSPGDTCVFTARCILNLLSSDTVVEGETAGTMLVIPVSVLQRLMQNVRVENALRGLALTRSSQIMGALERLLFTRVDKRLAMHLLQEAERTGGREIHLTHEQLARDISTAREVVSRTLQIFARDGMISLYRGVVRIERPDLLRTVK